MTLEERIEALERRQNLLRARQEIWHTITRYARGIDEMRPEELEAIFTDDAVSQTHPWTRRLAGKALVVKGFRNYQRTFQRPRRFITNEQIHVNDDGTAMGFANWFVVQSHEGKSYYGWGSYDWKFRYEDRSWKISEMIVTIDCMTTLDRGWGMLEDRVMPFPPRPGAGNPA